MSVKIQTPSMGSLPPHQRHAITIHMPGWDQMLRLMEKEPAFIQQATSFYPRILPHKDVKALFGAVLEQFGEQGQSVLLFLAPESANECKKYATASARGDDALAPEDIILKVLDIEIRLYAVFFPVVKMPIVMQFWINPGVGISSRLAEESLKHLELLHEVTRNEPPPTLEISPADKNLRERIAGLLERATKAPRKTQVTPEDVYLFQTGMASIYNVHQFLLSKYNTNTVLFGFAFHSTPHIFEDYGPGYKFLGLGTAEDLIELEEYLKAEKNEGRKVQALWTEFPTNPLTVTPDLTQLRVLATEYDFILIADDTVGSFCNIDLLGEGGADILVSSLTKSFSGYADVMAASAVLNPSSAQYNDLKALFKDKYVNRFYGGDAEVLEKNSRDYMSRSIILNRNAETLVAYLQSQVSNPSSSIAKVYYPTTSSTLSSYRARMRETTTDFTPGYGCLFTVELNTVEATIAFYNNINVHIGPHLGAHLTLALPYVKALYGKQLDWAAERDLRETQIRVAVGLEDTDELLQTFKNALVFADAAQPEETLVSNS
ncbi:related to O-succinylhomoserine (thiol)-lyase [Rhynchosporium secalis]|uniref:Related to O-succinylhomoserine (Thiol)-lyase n=1 Tax=Rhynchosporium secalis TaxID=38038 RepID=A0A1E1MF15_RHYSE|nr:related to O-succinylhomoserine (thiol)-lyase [Rhynchosporium secalis]